MGKDSSNMTPADWKAITEAIYIRRNRGYKGFVVAHGTDTLAFTASAVAFALGPGLSFPVVFTAAQSPRHVAHGDARPNLLRACTVATLNIPEVVIVTDDLIFRGVRAEKRDDYRFESFNSPTMPPLGIIADRIEVDWNLVRKRDESRDLECSAEFSPGVFKFDFVPGLHPGLLMPILDNPILKGIIIETPGIGIVPTEGDMSLLPFIEKATRDRRVPVLLVSQYPIQAQMAANYALASKPVSFGAIPAVNMSAPAAAAKFMWILPQIEKRLEAGMIVESEKFTEIKRWMSRNLVGETG
jgi:L-asparaginase